MSYDSEADAAYIRLQREISGDVDRTVMVDPSEIEGMINLDLDVDGRVLGIELLDASKKLPREMLRQMGATDDPAAGSLPGTSSRTHRPGLVGSNWLTESKQRRPVDDPAPDDRCGTHDRLPPSARSLQVDRGSALRLEIRWPPTGVTSYQGLSDPSGSVAAWTLQR